MRRTILTVAIFLGLLPSANAAELQGVLADWRCTERMVKDGREKTLKDDASCSLAKNPGRSEYGLITSEKKFYRFDKPGNDHARELLGNSHDKDDLRVVVRGELDGNTIKVQSMSIL
ncbi:MAG: hypothetical protein ACJ74Y_09295 [Bryobacteraceae bacterium]